MDIIDHLAQRHAPLNVYLKQTEAIYHVEARTNAIQNTTDVIIEIMNRINNSVYYTSGMQDVQFQQKTE